MWLDDVFIPWERVFLMDVTPEPMASWLFWHQLYCWLSKAEFTLGLALACTHAMGLVEHEPTIEYLIDLVVDVQTVRSCQTAAELDPELTAEGYCIPGRGHIAAGTIAMLKARQRMAEILRILPGSSLVVAPSDKDLAAPEVGAGLDGIVRGRRLHGAAALGLAAAGLRPRQLRARRPRVGLRAARQRRHPGVARTAAPLLQPLQRARQRCPALPEPRHAQARSRGPSRRSPHPAPPGEPAAVARGRSAAITRRQRRTVPGTSPSGMKTTITTKIAPSRKFHRSM